MEKFGGVAADGVHDLPDVVKRNATRTAAVVNACGEFMFKNVLHGAAKVRARKRIAVFVCEQSRRAAGAEPVRNPVDCAGASTGCVIHRERHAENYRVWLDGDNCVFGFGLVFAVIVDRVLGVRFDVRAVRLRLFVAAKDHVGGNADERRIIAGRKRGRVNALAIVQKAAPGRIAFACFQRAVPAGVDDGAKAKTLEKFAQTFRFFGVNSINVFAKNARVFDGANPDNAWSNLCAWGDVAFYGHATVQFVEMPEKRVTRNAVQPENQNREADCNNFHLK